MNIQDWSSETLKIDPFVFYKKIHHVFHTGESMVHGPSHINFWLPYFENVIDEVLILIRDKELYDWLILKYPRWSFAYAKSYKDIDQLLPKFKLISHMYYSSNTGNTIHTLKYNEIKHIFLGHGDSDKTASAHKYFRVYDEIWVSGQAHIDRFKNVGFDINKMIFQIVGRPPLRHILSNNKVAWNERMELSCLYLPTWEGVYEEGNYSSVGLSYQIMEVLLSVGVDTKITAKFHPVTGSRDPKLKNINQELPKKVNSEKLTIAEASVSVDYLITQSNIFICDISAVVSECLAANCPIFVYIPKDKDILIAKSDMIYEDYCYAFSTIDEFKTLFTQVVLQNDDFLKDARKEAIQYIISENETENLAFEKLLTDISKKCRNSLNLITVSRQ